MDGDTPFHNLNHKEFYLKKDGGEDEDEDGYAKETREILVKFPRLLVLEEGHTTWNEHNLVWKALKKVEI
ncbi:hypothetical protein EJD97_006660 [Solanum chilense]|uniref:Uncharacterized protein n=1 Tax=Solanum chilense TaxID=4083 RepID=A0A6N2AIN2_SOLCI|nr:hypothetical protein EJD97_006660 [Solanum chilense]